MQAHHAIASLTLAALVGLAAPAMAQEAAPSDAATQDHVIAGKAIPADQVDAIQERCDELRYQQGTTGTQSPETTMSESPGAGAVTGNPDTTAQAGGFDLESLTIAMCDEGGFEASDEAM